MAVAQAQMNVRINEDRKAAGDAVLAKFGVTPSHAVRALWEYLATYKMLPEFMVAEPGATEAADTLASEGLAEQGAGMAIRLAREMGLHCSSLQDATYAELKDAAFEERLVDLGRPEG